MTTLEVRKTDKMQVGGELVRGHDELKRSFPGITLPLLILHGTEDNATDGVGQSLASSSWKRGSARTASRSSSCS